MTGYICEKPGLYRAFSLYLTIPDYPGIYGLVDCEGLEGVVIE